MEAAADCARWSPLLAGSPGLLAARVSRYLPAQVDSDYEVLLCFFVSRALVKVYLYPHAQEMRVRSLLLLAGPAFLVYYVLRRRVRMRIYCLFRTLSTAAFFLHCILPGYGSGE